MKSTPSFIILSLTLEEPSVPPKDLAVRIVLLGLIANITYPPKARSLSVDDTPL